MGKRILVAEIGAAHGIRGEVRLRSFTQDPMAVKDYPLTSEDGTQNFVIESLRPAKDFLVARLAGIADRTTAERLRHIRLYVAREHLPEPEADEYFHADLIGLAAVATDGHDLGTVVAVHNFGAGDLIEIKPPAGASMMLPFNRTVVSEVDLSGRRLIVDPPEETTVEDEAGRRLSAGRGA
jgi:16S rRNA processing protein RimM